MTDPAIIYAAAGLLGALGTLATALAAYLHARTLAETRALKEHINSRMDEVIRSAKEIAFAAGYAAAQAVAEKANKPNG